MTDSHFSFEDVSHLSMFEQLLLESVYYMIWERHTEEAISRLVGVEMNFSPDKNLHLTSGPDDESILISTAEKYVENALKWRVENDDTSISILDASDSPVWDDVVGHELEGIRLAKTNQGLYENSSLLFDFGEELPSIVLFHALEGGLGLKII